MLELIDFCNHVYKCKTPTAYSKSKLELKLNLNKTLPEFASLFVITQPLSGKSKLELLKFDFNCKKER